MPKPHPDGLYSRTMRLLNERPRALTLQMIADDVEGISLGWLQKLVQNKIQHASVQRIEALYAYLNDDTNAGKPELYAFLTTKLTDKG